MQTALLRQGLGWHGLRAVGSRYKTIHLFEKIVGICDIYKGFINDTEALFLLSTDKTLDHILFSCRVVLQIM